MARVAVSLLYSSSSPQTVPLSIRGARQPGWALHLPPLELVRTRPPQRRWFRRPNLLRLNHPGRMTTTTCTFTCRRRVWRQWIMGSLRRCSTRCLRALGHIMQRLFFTPSRCSCRYPRRRSHVVISSRFHLRVSRSYRRVEVVIRTWVRWRPIRI